MKIAIVALLYASLVTVLAAPAHATLYEIDFKLTTNAAYEALQFRVGYSNASGDFVGTGDDVDCTVNTGMGALAALNDEDANDLLKQAYMTTAAFQGPILVSTCVFDRASGTPLASQFVITIDDWSASHSQPPTVAVTRIETLP